MDKKTIMKYFGFLISENMVKFGENYSKTPKTIFKNFAKPLNMEILSLFSKFTKVSRDLLFLNQGKKFFLSSLKTSQCKM